jgi:hypothetical protein
MRVPSGRWLAVQETAVHLDTTSAEVCRLLSIGRLSRTKQKDPRRGCTAQWLVDPKSINAEKKRGSAERARALRHNKPALESK